jgi:diguanylate cyclase (GGDEF)-like protein
VKPIDSVHFVNALAELTSHNDREIIERSLLETLSEFHGAEEYWLYQVLTIQPELSLGLLAYANDGKIVVSERVVKQQLPEKISQNVLEAVQKAKLTIAQTPESSQDIFTIYPALDQNKEVFAILIERGKEILPESQRLAHGFLRVYANYLRLLESNRRDTLTGLLNRETLEQEITRIIILNNECIPPGCPKEPEVDNESRQQKGELRNWLGVLDIDHFKRINDTFGHVYGDEILILIARIMEQSVRGYDLIFRYGGEEFVILLKAFDHEDAQSAFERIRTAVGHHDYAKVEQVTVSMGVIEIGHQSGPAEVIERADEALYYAKSHGRDQVQFYEDLVASGDIKPAVQEVESGGVSFF